MSESTYGSKLNPYRSTRTRHGFKGERLLVEHLLTPSDS